MAVNNSGNAFSTFKNAILISLYFSDCLHFKTWYHFTDSFSHTTAACTILFDLKRQKRASNYFQNRGFCAMRDSTHTCKWVGPSRNRISLRGSWAEKRSQNGRNGFMTVISAIKCTAECAWKGREWEEERERNKTNHDGSEKGNKI